jgi:hypothetical protein
MRWIDGEQQHASAVLASDHRFLHQAGVLRKAAAVERALLVVLLRLVHEDQDRLAAHVHALVIVVVQRRRGDPVPREDERQRRLGAGGRFGRHRHRKIGTPELEDGRAFSRSDCQLVAFPYLEACDDLKGLEPGSVHPGCHARRAELAGDVLRRTFHASSAVASSGEVVGCEKLDVFEIACLADRGRRRQLRVRADDSQHDGENGCTENSAVTHEGQK